MKTTPSSRRRQSGIASLLMLAILGVLLIYVAANVRSLDTLGRELQLVERTQVRRLAAHTNSINTVETLNR